MLKIIRKLFETLKRLESILTREYFGSFNGFFLVFIGIIVFVGIGKAIDDNFGINVFLRIAFFTMGTYIYSLVPFAVYCRC
ncbi:hypothetical protein [Anoxynatronum buryatiense]|uniref:Uncharacterized protein n=1 Tax=Anoxynatronum buryatiense TaxID=489973 RepID=A0AA45WY07_9CLOT|nr:hypothetical protein [Anoxynatronum buryatiense]SMP67142.1 hypothetical protein SAMN06296020_1152 [Anoxynatronum buryatiense]